MKSKHINLHILNTTLKQTRFKIKISTNKLKYIHRYNNQKHNTYDNQDIITVKKRWKFKQTQFNIKISTNKLKQPNQENSEEAHIIINLTLQQHIHNDTIILYTSIKQKENGKKQNQENGNTFSELL